MIRVVKDGKKPVKTKTIWCFTCPDCGCEFECELEDFKYKEKRPGGDMALQCPCCEKELHTNKNFYTTQEVRVYPAEVE